MSKAAHYLTLIAVVIASVGCEKKIAFDPQSVKGMKIVITDDSISFEGREIVLPVTIDALVAELGEPDEAHFLQYTIRVWNKLGFYCYTKPESRDVSDICIGFPFEDFEDFDFYPTNYFTGVVSVGSDHFHKGTSFRNLGASGFTATFPNSYTYTKEIGEISIYIHARDGKITSVAFDLPESDAESGRTRD